MRVFKNSFYGISVMPKEGQDRLFLSPSLNSGRGLGWGESDTIDLFKHAHVVPVCKKRLRSTPEAATCLDDLP
jgi:hypothetical protein